MADYYSNWASSVWGKAKYRLHLTLNVVRQDLAANTSTLAYDLRIEKDRSYDGYYLYHVTSYNLILNGVTVWAGSGANPNKAWTKWTPWILAQGEFPVTHNPDGTLPEIPINANYIRTANEWAPGSMVIGPGGTGPIFPPIARATTPSVTPSPAATGAEVTISLPRASASYTHDLSWVAGTQSGVIATGVAIAQTWTVPSVMGEFPGQATGPIVITAVTKNGATVLGSKQVTLLAKNPPAPPTINDHSAATQFDVRARLVRYEGGEWSARQTIPADTIKLVDSHSATATGSIALSRLNAVGFQDYSVVDIDVYNGEDWIFTNHRLVLARVEDDETDATQTATFTGTEYLDFLLGSAQIQVDHEWGGSNPGAIMANVLTDAIGRGWGPRVGFDFSATATSLGEPWANPIPNRKASAGTPLSQILEGLVNDGLVEYAVEYHSNKAWLKLYNPGTGRDFSAVGASPVVNLGLLKLSRAPRRSTIEGRITRVTVVGDDKIQATREKAVFDANVFGHLEGWVTASGVADVAGVGAIGDNALRDNSSPTNERTYEYEAQNAAPQYYPYSIFRTGDWLLRPDGENSVTDRIGQITINKTADASLSLTVLMGDRIMSGVASLAKRQNAQTGGAIGGGNGNSPSPIDSRIPSDPVVDLVTSAGYWNSDGAARSTVTMSWVAVTEAANGAPIAVDLYEVWWRPALLDEEWQLRGSTDQTSLIMGDWDVLQNVELRVRARSTAGVWGEFSEDQPITTLAPPVDLDGPLIADLYTDGVGSIYIVWPGLLGTDPAPARLAYVVAEVSSDGGLTYTTMGTPIPGPGTLVVNPGSYGSFTVRLRGYDRLGNAGDASDPEDITLVSPSFDPAIPLPPTNVQAVAGAAWNATGFLPEAWFDLTWDAPTLDTEGDPIIINGYDVLGLKAGESVERFITSTTSTGVRVPVGNGETWTFRVRAASNYGGVSTLSDTVTATADAVIPAAPAPDAPTLSQYAGILRIQWSGNGMQPYIKQVYATISTSPTGPFTRAGMPLLGAGEVVVPGLAPDVTYYARIVMVDELGSSVQSATSEGELLLPITGVTIQTSELANTGIKITNGGLTSYDVSGNPTFVLDAATGEVWIAPYDAVFELGAAGFVATTGAATTGIAISSDNSSFNTFVHPAGVQIRNDQTALSWWEADAEDASLVNFFSPRAVIGQRMRVGDYEMLREAKPTGSRLVIRYKGD